MKKVFTILTGALFFIGAYGQKDLEIKLLSPATGDDIYVNEPMPLVYSIKNVGSEMINADDSVFVNLLMGGDYVFGNFNNLLVEHANIPAGDSVYKSTSFVFTQKEIDDFSFCFEITTSNNGSRVDNNLANNKSCATISVKERGTTGIADLIANKTTITLYPNPATTSITIQTSNTEAAKVLITDVQGRGITTATLQNRTVLLPTDGLEAGIYFCQLITSDNLVIERAKFQVSR